MAMTIRSTDELRHSIAARASALTGVEIEAILAELAPDGLSHSAVSKQVGAALDQAIAEARAADPG
jgi:hypothetical protein